MKIIKNISFIFIVWIFINLFNQTISEEKETYILFKINNIVVTNRDVENEIRYLMAFNDNLKTLAKDELKQLASDSLTREIIKKNELIKYYDLNKENEYVEKVIKDFYLRLNLNSEKEFQTYLESKNVSFKSFKQKINIETAWNQFIFDKYNKLIEIDEASLKNKLNKKLKNIDELDKIFISEIFFSAENKSEFETKYSKIKESINNIGFSGTASVYSISDTAKFGGEIGWLSSNEMSNEIYSMIKNLNIGEYTNPINTAGGFLILQVVEKKKEKVKINYDEEFKKILKFEKDKKLNQYSSIFYKKIKQNSLINEL